MHTVSIIILNWNQPKFTINCVKSVLKQSYKDFEIILVDNGSTDNSLDLFKKEFGRNRKIRILETGKNLGYAGGNNEGAKSSKGEYVVILNNDTIVGKNWLIELIKGIKSDKEICAVSSSERREGKATLDWYRFGVTTNLIGYGVIYKKRGSKEKSNLFDTFMVNGASFIFRKDLIKQPFDSDYFAYAEDLYFSWLTRLGGLKIKIAPKSIFHHFHALTKKSIKKMEYYLTFLGERNRLMNLFLFYEKLTLLKLIPVILLNLFLLNIFEPKKIPYRLRSYSWLLVHLKRIFLKRKKIQKQRKISDKDLLQLMSCKLYEEKFIKNETFKKVLKVINKLVYFYCWLFRIKTIEFKEDL